jgi:5'-methylthioadenosine phosphorylase
MNRNIEIAIIGGSGLYQPSMLTETAEIEVETPYGSIQPVLGRSGERRVAFLARHGRDHSVLPHQVNYRANLWGLKQLGVQRILAVTAVGSLRREIGPGSLVVLDQFLDFTKQRPLTFFEQGNVHRAHVDVSFPYCPELREAIKRAAFGRGLEIHDGGCYVCAEGPRYETAAEIRMYQMLGGAVVGMTGVPEVVLARELGICYAGISVVTNWAAGIQPEPLAHADVVRLMAENQARIIDLIGACLGSIAAERGCECSRNGED